MRKGKDKADDLRQGAEPPGVRRWTRPANGLPEDLREHARLMCDIIAIAFQTDKTRIATLLLARDLSALYYPFLERGRWTSRRIAQQPLGRVRAHRPLPSEPARVSGRQAREHARGRWHGARQLVPDVALEHVDRAQARQYTAAAGDRRRTWRNAEDRPDVELRGRGRRQSQDVEPVPVAHGPHGCEVDQFGDASARLEGL